MPLLFNDLAFPLIRPPFLRRCFRFPPLLPFIFLTIVNVARGGYTRDNEPGQANSINPEATVFSSNSLDLVEFL